MLKYLKKYWLYCLLAPLFMLGELAMDLLQPYFMAFIVDEGVLGGDMQLIFDAGLQMLVLVALGGTCGVLCSVFANMAAQQFGNDIRKDMFAHIMDFSFAQTERFTTGSLVTRITNDVTQVEQMVMMAVRSLVRCTVMFVGGIYMLYLQSAQFALVAACGLPFLAAFVTFFLRKVAPLYTLIQQKIDRINCIMQENIAGARVVKAYVKEAYELAHFSEANDGLCATNLRAQTILAFLHPCVNIVMNICVVGVLYVGGYEAQRDGGITPGQTMAAITYLSLILLRVIFMANIFQTFTRAAASWQRIREVLNTENVQKSGISLPEESKKGEIEFRDVSFAYADAGESDVLHKVSFTVRQGETLAIIGPTGSGKTTVVNLLMRFYPVDAGEILIDGKNIMQLRRDWLRKNTAIVLQDTVLFSDTIENNIKYSNAEADDAAMLRAAETSNCASFIERLKDKYQTFLTQAGAGLSHGQRQLLNIARAIMADPKILILDEATSSVDTRTEQNIQDALVRLMQNRTSLIIAHRLSTIQDADVIVVMDKGRVVETGRHGELLQKQGAYYALYNAQFAGNAT